MSHAFRVVLALATCVTLVVAGCAGDSGSGTPAEHRGCITDFDPGADYFPDKSSVLDATNFSITYHGSYQVLTVTQPYPRGAPESYVLLRCGAPAPVLTGELAHAQRITVPVTGLFSASPTHLAMLTELESAAVVTGVANPGGVVDPQIRQRIDTGRVAGYAPGQQVNIEAVIGARPDVLITQGLDDPSYPKLRAGGVPVVADAEWLEATPLGRAEWVKVFAALTGTERRAAEVYRTIREGYRQTAETASGATPADVLIGTMYQGAWSMPTGTHYVGRLITDAGGGYPWAGRDSAQSLQLNFETVYANAGNTPLWLVTDDWATLDDALAQDNRYAELTAIRDGQVWSATRAVGPGGGNDFWERGVARPDLVLADLIAILHPELAPGHRFEFYRQVPRR